MAQSIGRNPLVFFDVLCEHDPSGTQPGDILKGTLRLRCWVRKIMAHDSEEAARKAEKFLTEQRGARNIRVKQWRLSRTPQEGVES